MTLAEFLTARLDEAEEIARATSRPAFRQWHAEPWYDGEFLNDRRTVRADLWGRTGFQFTNDGALSTLLLDHIVLHDPDRTLREVAAGRAFLALKPWDLETGELMDTIMRIRAAVYSDHPDYQPGWAV